MNAMLHLAVTLVMCTSAVRPLARARWVWRCPRTGIVVWQLLGVTWVLSAVGTVLAVGLAPYHVDIPTAFARWFATARGARGSVDPFHLVVPALALILAAVLLAQLVCAWVAVAQVRRRHRRVLALVGRHDPAAPGAVVLDHPMVVAYCLPGIPKAQVVLSSGALRVLTADQVAAVLAHERAHARERHDLVLLPFTALRRLFPRIRLVCLAAEAVSLLVEMRADERACREQSPRSLAGALHRFGAAPVGPPAGALGAGDAAVAARLLRISTGAAPLPAILRSSVLLAAAALVSTPLTFLLW